MIDNAVYIINNETSYFVKYWKYLIDNNYSITCYLRSPECLELDLFYKKIGIMMENDFHDAKTAKLFYERIHARLLEKSEYFILPPCFYQKSHCVQHKLSGEHSQT